MIILQLLSILLWLVLVPFCIGLIPIRWIPGQKRNAGVVFAAGYLLMLPVFWLVSVPAIVLVKYENFLVAVRLFTVCSLLLAAAGILLTIRAVRLKEWASLKPTFRMKDISLEEKVMWGLFFALLFFQLYKAFTMTSFDGDDAEYVVRSLIAQQSNVMYTILPFTGGTAELDVRHALAVLPVFIAYVGRMTNIHVTIISHSVLPLLFIPLTYLIYFEAGKNLLKKKKEMLPAFMTLLALLQIFGNVSIYTSETFLLTRTWQGKSFAANFVIPAVIWLLLLIYDKEADSMKADNMKADNIKKYRMKSKNFGFWLLLWLANMTAGICSSQAVFFCMIIIGIAAFFQSVSERKFSILVKSGIVCIPNVIYMVLYLFLH